MIKKHRLWLALIGLVLSASFPARGARPNVILILTDDQGYGDMACHGNPWLKTPHLDRLHAGGVSLADYHVDPVCTPTRAALMTGRYCTRVGAWAVTEGRQLLNPGETTMANVFSNSGYRTAMFGKWHLGDTYPYAPQYRGFQEVLCHRAGGVDEIGNPAGNNHFDDTYFRNGKPEQCKGYCTDVFFNGAMQFIRRVHGEPDRKPFFIYLPLNAMHSPFRVAPEYAAPYLARGIPRDRAYFYGMIANFDENLGRLQALLSDLKLAQETILIFMGDNGTAAGISRRDASDGFNAGMRDMKGSVYEGGHRVACFVRWPGRLKAGHRVNRLTCHRDWLPTLIDLCDLTRPEGVRFDGRSIAPLLKNSDADWPERTLFIDRQFDKLKPGGAGRFPQYAVLTEKWRLVNGELYDIDADPGQRRNLAARKPDIAERLLSAYRDWYDDVASHGGAYTRFHIGAPEENPTSFTVRDWHPTEGRVIWQPKQLADDALFINGFWAIDVVRRGCYELRLSRHPGDALKPMGAGLAKIKIGDIIQAKVVKPEDKYVTFKLNLNKGPALLETGLIDEKTRQARGAYFVTCRWLSAD